MGVRELGIAPQKALETVLYIASRLESSDLHSVLKIRYFADKLHLSQYGFPASGDRYVAMEFGPVASCIYDILKVARGDGSSWAQQTYGPLVRGVLEVESGGSHRVSPKRAADTSFLSQSDIQSLDEAIKRYGGMKFDERTKVSHDAAWTAAWDRAQAEHRGQYPMPLKSIAGVLENAKEVLAYLES